MDRIKAFTLIEMVLAMMLAAIVIGMTFSAFTVFSRLYKGYHDKNLSHADVRIFKQVLETDVWNARLIELADGRISFKDAADGGDVIYSFGKDYLIRTSYVVPDTFEMKNLSFKASFEGIDANRGIVDLLMFRFDYDKTLMRIGTAKTYSSADLFYYQDSVWK